CGVPAVFSLFVFCHNISSSLKMSIKNTPVQVLEDCGIISLLRDDHTGLQTCIDSLIRFGAGNTGADFLL
ncbi:hypothetical protein, partial [Hominisplanchenecus faecis]|uniref:hypothetical protein n=1 Tax=Hominisplanchenecus faecis TaxID=2885351 RepID=UPI0032C0EDC7